MRWRAWAIQPSTARRLRVEMLGNRRCVRSREVLERGDADRSKASCEHASDPLDLGEVVGRFAGPHPKGRWLGLPRECE